MQNKKTIGLVILDGWGISLTKHGNAILGARTPIMNALERNYPYATLRAAGNDVGLYWGEPGNSEVGHTNLGAGFIRYQNLPRILMEIQNGRFFGNPVLHYAIQHCLENRSALHLLGLISEGKVHSSLKHAGAVLEYARHKKVKKVFIHAFLDGRDVAPRSAAVYFAELKKLIRKHHTGVIASVSGRFYSMDRNNNWDRTEKAYQAICGVGPSIGSEKEAWEAAYRKETSEEFAEPAFITKWGKPVGPVEDGDALLFFNYRPDRIKQLTMAFSLPEFHRFRAKSFKNLPVFTMTKYEEALPVKVLYPDIPIEEPLAQVVSAAGLKQLHIAETEKYAHVTYFFNGGRETPFDGEQPVLIPSPAVSNYAERPDMSARLIGDRVEKEVRAGSRNFILVNLANPDMIGHTGNYEAAVTAIETVDEVLGRMVQAFLDTKSELIITADHGNAEQMINPVTGKPDTSHTTNPVPLIVVGEAYRARREESRVLEAKAQPLGLLADVAPTLIELMQLKKPDVMSGRSLLKDVI